MNKQKAVKKSPVKKVSKKNLLCFVIVTANRPDAVDGNLLQSAEGFYKCGIDVYVYDSSDNDETKYIVEWHSKKYSNIKYVRWNGKYDGVSIDNKVIDAYKEFSEKYDYVWLSRDGTPVNILDGYEKVFDKIDKNNDIIILNGRDRDYKFIGEKEYNSAIELFKDQCHQMTILGVTIVKSSFIQKVILENPVDFEKNYGMWQPIAFFNTIAHQEFHAASVLFSVFLPNNKANKGSFWHKNIIWQWGMRWYKMIMALPECYSKYKAEILHFDLMDFNPFSIKSILQSRALGGQSLSNVFLNRFYLKKTSSRPVFHFYMISCLPKCICSFCNKIIAKRDRKRKYHAFMEKSALSSKIRDYEKIENCFEKVKDVISTKVYEQNDVSDPFITIVVPTYKRVDLLKYAMESIVNQRRIDKWDILIVDNEPYDGKPNKTEEYIRSLNLNNVTYYRNSENMRPADNFNRGILLAKAPWVMMLHDDDLLTADALVIMERSIRFLSAQKGKPLGAIAAAYYQFYSDPNNPQQSLNEIKEVEKKHLSSFPSYMYFKLTHANVLCTGHIGGSVPSNGAVYRRQAVLETGGFNDDNGISGDLILYYNLEKKYSVYHNLDMTGYYRWGNNSMSLPESSYKTIRDGYLFREYVFSKTLFHRIYGKLFRSTLYYMFTGGVIEQRKKCFSDYTDFACYAGVYNIKPNKFMRFVFNKITKVYSKIKRIQMKRLRRKAKEFFKVKKG